MSWAFDGVWQAVGKQYEALVYERSRTAAVLAQRAALKIDFAKQPETNLARKIELTECIMAALAELKEL